LSGHRDCQEESRDQEVYAHANSRPSRRSTAGQHPCSVRAARART
jgi:hypothetical protein